MKSFLIVLSLIFSIHFIGNAQIIKLKSVEGYVQTEDYVKLHYQILGQGQDTIVVIHGGGVFGSAYLVPDLTPSCPGVFRSSWRWLFHCGKRYYKVFHK